MLLGGDGNGTGGRHNATIRHIVGVEGGGVHAVVHVVQRGVEVGHHLGVRCGESRYNRKLCFN